VSETKEGFRMKRIGQGRLRTASGRRFKGQLQDEDSRDNFRTKIQGTASGRRFKGQLQDEDSKDNFRTKNIASRICNNRE